MTFDHLLAEIQTASLTLKPRQPNTMAVNHIFQVLKSIQNLAAIRGLEEVDSFTGHVRELVLQVRLGKVPVTDHFPGVMIAAVCQIELLLTAAQGGPPVDLNFQAALLETVFQMTEPAGPLLKIHPPEAEASVQDAIVLPTAESVSAC